MNQAKCKDKAPNKRLNPDDPDPWFPEKGASLNKGKIQCFTCDVRAECADYRQRTDSRYGMWAGQIQNRDSNDED